jgi:hypothetical protein
MPRSNGRVLTEKQHYRLEKIIDLYPEAVVTGWHNKDSEQRQGPVIWFPRQATTKFVDIDGVVKAGA